MLRQDGFDLKSLRKAGFTADELFRDGFEIGDIRKAGYTPMELRRFSVPVLKEGGYGPGDLREAKWWSAAVVKAGGFKKEEMLAGGWDAAEVERLYFSEEDASEGRHTVELEDIDKKHKALIDVQRRYHEHARERHEKGRPTYWHRSSLSNIEKSIERREKKEKRELEEERAELARMRQIKKQDEEAHAKAKQELKDAIKTRREELKEARKRRFAKVRKQLETLENQRQECVLEISEHNRFLYTRYYPPTGYELHVTRGAAERDRRLGEPPSARDVLDPALDVTGMKPIARLLELDRQIEKLAWNVQEIDAELRALGRYENSLEAERALVEHVNDLRVAHKCLRWLAHQASSEACLIRLPDGETGDSKTRRPGSLSFDLTFGLTFGQGSVGAGLALALSGSIALKDNRAVRANVSLSLAPTFKAGIKRGGTDLAGFSAALAFTLENRSLQFVDEEHFAYYFAYRLAALGKFHDRFTTYG